VTSIDLLKANLLSPMVLCFALGGLARFLRSDLRLPESVYAALSTYLLLSIGLKGGVALSNEDVSTIIAPVAATLLLGVAIPPIVFGVCRGIGRLNTADSAALAAHYGSVSAVTFIATQTFLAAFHVPVEGYLPALVAVLEIPAIVVGLLLARKELAGGGTLRTALHEILTGKSVVLLAGGTVIGFLTGEQGFAHVKEFFVTPFQGVLCLFLLDMGLHAAMKLREARRAGPFLILFAIIGPLCFGGLGILAGYLAGLGLGGSTVLGAMSASASYIAAPAAIRLSLPKANPSIYLTAAVGITFPFNLALGIPIYFSVARWLFAP